MTLDQAHDIIFTIRNVFDASAELEGERYESPYQYGGTPTVAVVVNDIQIANMAVGYLRGLEVGLRDDCPLWEGFKLKIDSGVNHASIIY